jgi:hypothetical protein
MPSPKGKESKSNFISRCMKDSEMEKYPHKQRLAICYSYWRRAKNEDFTGKVRQYIKEIQIEAGPKGWNITTGAGKKITPDKLPTQQKKLFDQVRNKLKEQGLLNKLTKTANAKPDMVFKSDAVEVYDEDGNKVKTFKI